MFYDIFIQNVINEGYENESDSESVYGIGTCIDDKIKTFDNIRKCSKILLKRIIKPFRCIVNNEDYFVGLDIFTNVYCLYYRNLMMIDLDTIIQEEYVINSVKHFHKKYGDTYKIYKSKRGYHIFVVNRLFDYKSREAIEYMLDFDCDFYYTVFTYLSGWVVRLSRKSRNENETQIYKYLCTVGDEFKYEYLVDIHEEFVEKFKETIKFKEMK